VTLSPARFPHALAGLTAVVALSLTGCAGTDSSASEGTGSSSPSSSTGSSAPAESSAAQTTRTEAMGQRIAVEVVGGQVTGDTGRVPVPAGEQVTLVVTSDVADTVHVHGYDLEAALARATPTTLTFDATVPGVFEVELHDAGTVLLTLQVE
jgi:hypothetical protein